MEQQYPLTKQQEGLWVEWRLHPENTSYNTCVKLRLSGGLDKDRFERALRDCVQFFSSLRVYFVEERGVPFQRIKEHADFVLDYQDISVLGQSGESAEQAARAKAFLEQKLRDPVDLKIFPIVRAGLIKTAPDVHYFIGLVPHMISDGGSAILFLEATSIAYNKGHAGLEDAYGTDKKDWNDYFTAQADKHDDAAAAASAQYWKARMDGAQHIVDFSHGKSQGAEILKTGKRVYFDLNAELSQSLRVYSRAQKTTLFSTLVATFGLLVHRYYGQDDILIGYPVNIRPPGYKCLFGFFVNIVPIRIDLSGDPSYEDLVLRVSASRKADKKHQEFPALEIVSEIRKDLSDFDGRVFNLSMAQTVSRLVNLRLDDVQSDPLEAEYNDVNDDLSLSYELLEGGRIGLWIEYRESLFDEGFVAQMITHIQSLLGQVVAAPQNKLSSYTLLTPDEYQLFLEKWAHPDQEFLMNVEGQTIHGLIEDCAAKNPDAVALVYVAEQITYTQMNARANQIAARLQVQGLQKGDRVALCLRSGPEMIYALLAVLKAGGAYVPLPPCYPQERLAFVLRDADAKVLITQDSLAARFDEIDVPAFLLVDGVEATNDDPGNPETGVSDEDACYIIYTSGSTGNPKGVLLNHGNVVPRLLWLQAEINLTTNDVVLQNTDYSFDVSVAEIFWPLTTGARLILTEAGQRKDPSYLIYLIAQHNVTTSCMVPSLINSVLAVLKDPAALGSLKTLLSAGEILPSSLVRAYHQKMTGDLYNIYGPTEGAIYAAFQLCPRGDERAITPIGRPIAETTLYVLDEQQRPQPVGVAGELYIGGAGVAQGYVNRPDLTDVRFIADPFSTAPGARLYKTGDLARFTANGDIESLGRKDAQVKIRGFRIELSEIEVVLSLYDGTQDVAVIDYGPDDHKRLVAYYVSEAPCDAEELKAHIARKLPDYMIPAFLVPIDAVPRLASGKVNRRALPNPEILVKKRAEYVAPSSEMEQELSELWADILKIPAEKIGVHDSFFEMGGDSLMAIQFVCAAEEAGIAFATNSLFEHRTIAALAKVAGVIDADKNALSQAAIEGTYPLLPRQAKFFADDFAQPHHWNRFFFFDVDHDADLVHLHAAFDAVLTHHDNLRVSFVMDAEGVWQQSCSADLPTGEYVLSHDLSALSGAEQERKIVQLSNEHQASLDLGAATLLRVIHFKTGADSGKLSVIIHHLLIDMVSARIIFEDFIKSYDAARLGLVFPLANKTASVQAWSEYLQILSKTKDFSEEIAYWGDASIAPTPRFAQDDQDVPQGTQASARLEKVILSPEDTAAMLRDIPEGYSVGIQDFLLSCLLQATKAQTGDDHLVVNICGHGRDGGPGLNLSRTVAWVNTVFPVHLHCRPSSEGLPASELMVQIRQQLDLVPPKNAYYNLLRYGIQHPDITKYPEPDIFFNYVSQIDALIPEGLAFKPAKEPEGICSVHADNHLCYALYIEAGVIDKCLNIHITYSAALLKPEMARGFTQAFEDKIKAALRELKAAKNLAYAAE